MPGQPTTVPQGPAASTIFWAEDAFDDQYMIRDVARGVRPGLTIQFYWDGLELIDALQEELPDLAVLDVRMPRMDGLETLRAIRKDPRLRDLPVCMFSTARVDAEVAACEAMGIDAYIQKPTRYDDFAAAVRGILLRAAPLVRAGHNA